MHEAHRGAGAARAAGAADPVHVVLGELRQVVVEHVRDAGDVDPARGDVGCDEHAHAALAQRADRAVARALRQVAVQRGRLEAGVGEAAGELVGVDLGRGEDDRLIERDIAQQVIEQAILVIAVVDVVHGLRDVRARFDLLRDLDALRILQQTVRERADLAVERRREQHRLARRGRRRDDRVDVVDETHVEHAVGFVEHEHLQFGQIDAAALEVVEQAPRRRDEDLRVLREQHQLLAVRDAAEDADRAQAAQVLAVRRRGRRHLHRELARRREDEQAGARDGLRAAAAALARLPFARRARLLRLRLLQLREALDRGQHERGRLAGARRARHEQVAAGDAGRNRALLHGRRLHVAGRLQRGDDLRRQAERRERRFVRRGVAGVAGLARGRLSGGGGQAERLVGDRVERAEGMARSHVNP
ncbi:DEAD/DEAH box helicase domain protein [Burkholderia mallei]|nr:DEAD/DEAH box helicase domain protein [Burkholderia mallei]KOT25652.1 DEAD/DEAH box helicase domain protein [Burkholderia mallei]